MKDFLIFFTFLFFLNDIILQWVLELVAKIYKYFNKFAPPIWFIAKTWLNCFMDDLQENYRIEKMKRLKNSSMSLLLSTFIIHLFIYLLNENC